MFLSMQSLNGDSYQGAQVGANVQSQVGPPTRTVPDNAVQRAVPCLACVLDWAIHRAAWIITKKSRLQSDLQLAILLWMEHFACQKTSHPIAFKQGYWLEFQTFQLTWMHLALTWTLGLVLGFWVRCSPPFFLYFYIAVSSCYCVLLSSILYVI